MTNPKALAEQLEPCPFCGGEAEVQHSYHEDDQRCPRDFWHVRVTCTVCGVTRPDWDRYGNQEQRAANFHVKQVAEQEAIAAWNTRASLPQAEPACWPERWRTQGYNSAFTQAAKALRFLAVNDRPSGGEQFPNSACCFMIADELEYSVRILSGTEAKAEPAGDVGEREPHIRRVERIALSTREFFEEGLSDIPPETIERIAALAADSMAAELTGETYAALAPTPTASEPAAKPVAWMYSSARNPKCVYTYKNRQSDFPDNPLWNGWVETPLYAAPVASGEVTKADKELIEAAVELRRSAKELRDNARGDCSAIGQAIKLEARATAIEGPPQQFTEQELFLARTLDKAPARSGGP